MASAGEKRKQKGKECGAASGCKSNEARPHKIEEVNRDFQSEGNVWLISSDGPRFRCWDYDLKAASQVFATMLTALPPSDSIEIELTDETIEDSIIIEIVLRALNGDIAGILAEYNEDARYETALFLRKYEMTDYIDRLKAAIKPNKANGKTKTDDINAWKDVHVFALGAIFEDVQLCAAAVEFGHFAVWNWDSDYCSGDPLEDPEWGVPCMDLRGAPLRYMRMIPLEYTLALLRAGIGRINHDRSDWETIASEFKNYMGCDDVD